MRYSFRHPDAAETRLSPSIISDYRWGWGLGGLRGVRGGFRGHWGGFLGAGRQNEAKQPPARRISRRGFRSAFRRTLPCPGPRAKKSRRAPFRLGRAMKAWRRRFERGGPPPLEWRENWG